MRSAGSAIWLIGREAAGDLHGAGSSARIFLIVWGLGRRPKRTSQIVASSLGRKAGYSALSWTIARRMTGGKDAARAGAAAAEETDHALGVEAIGLTRRSVRSGIPVCLARSAGEKPNRTTGGSTHS